MQLFNIIKQPIIEIFKEDIYRENSEIMKRIQLTKLIEIINRESWNQWCVMYCKEDCAGENRLSRSC